MEKAQQLSFFEEALAEKVERLEKWIVSKSKKYEQEVYVARQEIFILKQLYKLPGERQKGKKIEQLTMFG